MGNGTVNNKQGNKGTNDGSFCMQWSRCRPILMFILWYLLIIVIVFIGNYSSFKSFWATYFALSFSILPLPFTIFPAIIVSIRTKNNKSNPDYINSILYIDGRKIETINNIPFQCKFYCFHRTNYDVYLCYKGKIYSKVANLYEERVCSLEITVDD